MTYWTSHALTGNSGTAIPRIIHQTYPTTQLPEHLSNNVETTRQQNPGWSHRLYDDAAIQEFIRREYPAKIFSYYNRIDPQYGAAKADFFRYLLLYKVGGVYLDIKSRFNAEIDSIIQGNEGFIVSHWSNRKGEKYEGYGFYDEINDDRGEIQQWHIIAAPFHPFLQAVILEVLRGIDQYKPWSHGTGKPGVLKLTGPIMYTRTIGPLVGLYPCKILDNEGQLSLEYSTVPGDGHQHLFKRHYSTSRRPIVTARGLKRIPWKLYILIRVAKDRLLGEVTEIRAPVKRAFARTATLIRMCVSVRERSDRN